MSEPGQGLRAAVTTRSAAVGVVAVIAGLLFAMNATIFADGGERRPQDLTGLVMEESRQLDEQNVAVEELRQEVADLQAAVGGGNSVHDDAAFAAGLVAVTGPGVRVELSDAPTTGVLPEGARADDLVVHQQDLEATINALWAGGAEAMTIQGQRVTATTAVRCVGNVLLLHGRRYSPPYVVEALGDADRLTASLEASPALTVYRQYVASFGLGWRVEEFSESHFAAFDGSQTFRFLTVPGQDPAVLNPPSPSREADDDRA